MIEVGLKIKSNESFIYKFVSDCNEIVLDEVSGLFIERKHEIVHVQVFNMHHDFKCEVFFIL